MSESETKSSLFKNIKYKISGVVSDEVIKLLKNGGAEGFGYFSDYVTHCIVGEDPSDSDISDANDLYEVPVVTSNWVRLSAKCGKLLPIKGFSYGDGQLFLGVNASLSQVSSSDAQAIWAMVTYNGGKCTLKLTSNTTHLIVGKPTGVKYDKVVGGSKENSFNVQPVTPDWVLESIKEGTKCKETSYHPRLLTEKQSTLSKPAGGLSTAHITGFVDDEVTSEDNTTAPALSNELLEQLKQRMPWNQPSSTTTTSTTTIIQSSQLQPQIQLQQQQLVTQQQQILLPQQVKPHQFIVKGGEPPQPRYGTATTSIMSTSQNMWQPHSQPPQQQQQTSQPISSQTSQPMSSQTPRPMSSQTPQLFQQIRQQQVQSQQPQPLTNPQIQQRITWTQGGASGAAGGPQRQFIHMDAQTHAQLQQMDPAQRALFLQSLQKQRQLVLQQQLQQQQQQVQHRQTTQVGQSPGIGANSMVGARPSQVTAVIRGHLPPGLTPQQQLQWVQHRNHQQILIHQNPQLRHQVLLQQQQQQQAPQQQQPLPKQAAGAISGQNPAMQLSSQQQRTVVSNAGMHQQTVVIQQTGGSNAVPWQESQLPANQLAQLKLRQQQHLQLQRLQQLKQQQQAQRPSTPGLLYNTHQEAIAGNCSTASSPTVNAVTQVQSSGINQHPNIGSTTAAASNSDEQNTSFSGITQDVFSLEGSASGQLRLMTAQHHAQLHQPPTPAPQPSNQAGATQSSTSISSPQRIALGNVENVPSPHNPHGTRGLVVGVSGVKSPYTQTAARVAAVLAKSAAATPAPGPVQPRAQFYGHNPNLKLPPDMCLLGCIFLIVEYDRSGYDVQLWQRIVTENGGDVETSYSLRVTHILCQTQKHPLVQQGLRDGKRCITADWLSDIMIKQQVLPPWLALHFPTPFSDEKPCRNLLISYSGFEGEERDRVKQMIETVGSKITSYYSSHNHILVCRRPEGEKYRKAREWGKSVVNVQWLNEILFGHYSCLQQADSHKYQQFNLGNPFRIDYALVPHLMAAWKMPINVLQESYDRLNSSPPLTPRRKRPRLSNASLVTQDHDQENKDMSMDVTVTNPDPPSPTKRPYIIFSGLDDTAEEQKKVWQLGGIVTKNCREATHLIMSKPQRTYKLMCCLSTCKHIVSLNWLSESHEQNTFLDEETYGITNSELEKAFGFTISSVLKNPGRNQIFKGKIFYITPGVVPAPSALKEIIECGGGTVDKRRKSLKQIQELEPLTYLIITVKNDLHLIADVLRANIGVYNAEFVMSAVMKQKIDYDSAVKRSQFIRK